MTNKEFEKAMRFILEQQAQFDRDSQHIIKRVSSCETRMDENVSRLETNLAQMEIAETHMDKAMAAMVATHTHTVLRLDGFIGVLERYISEGRHGQGN